MSESKRIAIGPAVKYPEGKPHCVDVAGRSLAVLRHEDKVYAIEDMCPHRGGPLSKGVLTKGALVCPLHAWAFDVKTGSMLGSSTVSVNTFEVVEDHEELFVVVAASDGAEP